MGIFDKFSKKKKKDAENESVLEKNTQEAEDSSEVAKEEEKETQNKEEKVADIKAEENSNDNEEKKPAENAEAQKVDDFGRFTIMVEEVFQLKDDMGIVASGNVHGMIKEHDKVYIIHPAIPEPILTEIDSIEIGPGKSATSARDCTVAVRIKSIKDKNLLPKFAVITNIRPQAKVDASQPLENPFLLGLSYEYPRFYQDRGYFNISTFAIFSSPFITPVRIDSELEKRPDGTALLTKNTKVGFKLLAHPQDPSLHVLPVFSDWAALKNWKDAFAGEAQPKTVCMNYDQCANIGMNNKAGFVINPYGPVAMYVSVDIINSIQKMKTELDQKIAEAKKNENGESNS